MTEILADVTRGYNVLLNHGGGVETAWYPDGSVGVRHTCDRGKRGVIICAPRLVLDGPSGHTITSGPREPLTVSPSVGCDDCGLHGFIRNGIWEAC